VGGLKAGSLQVRPAVSAADLAAVRALFREYAASLETDLSFQGFDAELRGLPGAYHPPGGALLVADVAGEIRGCIALRPLEPPAVGEIKRLYVRPSGRGQGLGLALAQAVLESARAAGYRRVRLDTLPSMSAAQAMYQRLGFHEIEPYRHNPVPGARFMELELASRPAWHALLGPLPPGTAPSRTPVGPPEVLRSPAGAAIAGWENLVLELSAGDAGLRVLQVLMDQTGQPISASDHVLYRSPHPSDPSAPAEMEHQSIGGRIESGGAFRGTCWHASGPEPPEGQEPRWHMISRPPTAAEIAALLGLVAELLKRSPQ
jgi:ribosomal protein S18 acetylase RimI-like enzyme